MTEPRIADLAGALRDRTHPAVGVWNRLEGRPRTTDFARALRAEVRDALWMLTRQWQLGEFRGDDAGSPVTAKYAVTTSTPSRIRPEGGPPEPLPTDRPLETVAERRPLPFAFGAERISYDLRLALGRRWLKLVTGTSVFRAHQVPRQYIERYPVPLPDPGDETDSGLVAHPEVWATMQALAGRRMDGHLLYRHLKGGGRASEGIDLPRPHRAALDALGPRLTDWFDALIDQPDEAHTTWQPRALEHSFAISAAAPEGGERVLTAAEYSGGTLDWYAFSADPGGSLGGTDPRPAPTPRTVFPTPVRFAGMPLPRWWALEDGRTNFAAVNPDSTDLARLIFLEFALVFSNDWYQLPCDVPAGTLATVRGLAVTDVFGQRRWITPAGTGERQDWQRWSMFTLGAEGETGLLLPPGTPKTATGPALEDVALVRDENANLVWGIEQTVQLAGGAGRNGDEAAAETLAHRLRLHPPEPPDDPRAPVAYRIAGSVPENWIPFIPVRVPGDSRSVQLQRAAMPSAADGTPVRPRTSLLREGLDAGRPYFVNEEEVPRTGTRVTVSFNRTRWRDGRVVVWLTAQRATGRGERSSGLGFDLLTDTGR
ncbi:hypothetical protein ABT390_28035 [Streptomyces aurantiacus]|uniref:Uncharacterized protein n=1 Tax=Streptomyces aurantiacus JA 4570 TaxID=1286094 RepID=S3ZDV3_9ACTN|nr:hypothetical protein [Streptomyces aurantiacus]EPH41318.1 hypothetical protein STRAU_5554 [Streptomyces aurantiacus JA 4570]